MSLRYGLLVLSAVILPSTSAAQAAPPPPEVQGWIEEIMEIQRTIGPVQQQALEEPAIQARQQQVTAAVRDAMVKADPTMAQKLDRMDVIMAEARAAQEAGDQEKITALTAEVQTLQPQVMQAQQDAMEQPEVEAQLVAFRGQLHSRMIEIDPETGPLIERMEQLNERVKEAMRRQGLG